MNHQNPEIGKWTREQAWEWYNAQPWIRGYNGYPSNCVNRIAMWQEHRHEEVFRQIDLEFALAKETGFNAVRAILQFEVWFYQHDSFMRHFEEYLTLAEKNGLRVMVVLGNDCTIPKSCFQPAVFGEQPVDWGYHSGICRGPHSGHNECGYQLIDEPEMAPEYDRMVDELAKKYGRDGRILIWNVWNEIGNGRRGMLSVPHMERFFAILRENGVTQPLTAEVWSHTPGRNEIREPERRALDLSDIITFHFYNEMPRMIWLIQELEQEYGRPMMNTEWLNRITGNNVENIFPLLYAYRIGSFHWGLIQGFSQTWEPYARFFREQSQGTPHDLTKWQHDLYRFNGYPYDPREIEIIKEITEAADRKDGIL